MSTTWQPGMKRSSPTQRRRKEQPADHEAADPKFAAAVLAEGVGMNGLVTLQFAGTKDVMKTIPDMVDALRSQGEAVNRGDLSAGERLLSSQVAALNSVFGELSRRAVMNMNHHLGATETYLRLALKAQSQCRATLERLAAMKNPPVVIARQANINNGGQQQVNNGAAPNSMPTNSRPRETASEPNELLEDRTHGSPTLDTRAASAAGKTNQGLDPVAAVNRTAQR